MSASTLAPAPAPASSAGGGLVVPGVPQVSGWSVALALDTIVRRLHRLPRERAAEVRHVSCSIRRGGLVLAAVRVRSATSWRTASDAATLLAWRELLDDAHTLLVPITAVPGIVEATVQGLIGTVTVAAGCTLQLSDKQLERLQERPQIGYAILVELAGGTR